MKGVILLLLIVFLVILYGVISLIPDPEWRARGYCHINDPWEPPQTITNILTPEECSQIIEFSTPRFRRSSVVGSTAPDDVRTSDTAWVPRDHPLARKLIERACHLTGKDPDHCEDLQVVRYRPGTYYRPHHDACCDDARGCEAFEKMGGQRIGTLFVYLNSDFTEGETHFPKLERQFRGTPGMGVFFRPLDTEFKKCHPLALHGGKPPGSGTKYGCNVWVRENKFVSTLKNEP